MNLLGATNKFLWESALADQQVTLVDAADDVLQAAEWIKSSWIEFQTKRYWKFRWAEGSFTVIKGKTSYTIDDTGRADGDVIIRESFYNAAGDITSLPYTELRAIRRAAGTVDNSRLTHIAVEVGPTFETYPDIELDQVVQYDYWKAAQEVTVDADTFVGLPADFHMMIVHLALTNYGAHVAGQEGANAYAHHGSKFAQLRSQYVLYAGEDNQIPIIKKSLL